MKQKVLVGQLFGVNITLPLEETQLREAILFGQQEFIEEIQEQYNLDIDDANEIASKQIIDFSNNLDLDTQTKFLDIIEELLQEHVDSLYDNENLDIMEKQQEANYSYNQADMIYSELIGNLRVYGSNSPLKTPISANIQLALEHIDRCLEHYPDDPQYLNLKGLLVWQGLDSKKLAFPILKKAADLAPRDINIQNNFRAIQESNGCFIATASFGTPLANEVNLLRIWRDEELTSSKYGRQLIKIYYKISPPIAHFIQEKPIIKKIVRFILKPLLHYIESSKKYDI